MQRHSHNLPVLKSFRSILRRKPTPQEVLLWSRLRGGQLGVKFRRQHSVGIYILDFYCSETKLAIELDGSQHADNDRYDTERTAYLRTQGIRVLRFWNNEAFTNISGVLELIAESLRSTPP